MSKRIWAVITSWHARRSIEMVLVGVFLLLLFSVVGVPMVLLSTFPPSWRRDGVQADETEADEIDSLRASAAL